MVTVAAIAILVILLLLTIFQCALIAGAPLGHFAWGGQHKVLPVRLRIGSVVSIAIYGLLAVLVASRAELVDVISEGRFLQVSLWVATGYLAMGIVLNGISKSKPERYTMTPVVTVLVLCFAVVTIG